MNTINIQTAKTSELVAFFNAHAEQPVKRFADRQTAEKRVAALLAAAPAEKSYGEEVSGLKHCPACNIDLSNGIGQHGDEVNSKKIKHEKFMFACLGCGHEFGPAIPGKHIPDAARSAGVAKSWADASVRAARSARHAVTVNGVQYGSVMKAFTALGLPKGKLIRFRGELKKAGEGVFEGHDFKLVAA